MNRLIAFILGGAALALYAPYLFLPEKQLMEYSSWWRDTLGVEWYAKIFTLGPGIFAGLALVLLAVRSKN